MREELIKGADVVSMFCRLYINTKKDLPVRSREMALLILICESENPITPVMAADFFKVKKPMITTLVSSLLKRGYIEKVPSQKDKRSFSLSPTAKARQLVVDTFTEYTKTIELLRQRLGAKDFGNLLALLEKANAALLEDKNNG